MAIHTRSAQFVTVISLSFLSTFKCQEGIPPGESYRKNRNDHLMNNNAQNIEIPKLYSHSNSNLNENTITLTTENNIDSHSSNIMNPATDFQDKYIQSDVPALNSNFNRNFINEYDKKFSNFRLYRPPDNRAEDKRILNEHIMKINRNNSNSLRNNYYNAFTFSHLLNAYTNTPFKESKNPTTPPFKNNKQTLENAKDLEGTRNSVLYNSNGVTMQSSSYFKYDPTKINNRQTHPTASISFPRAGILQENKLKEFPINSDSGTQISHADNENSNRQLNVDEISKLNQILSKLVSRNNNYYDDIVDSKTNKEHVTIENRGHNKVTRPSIYNPISLRRQKQITALRKADDIERLRRQEQGPTAQADPLEGSTPEAETLETSSVGLNVTEQAFLDITGTLADTDITDEITSLEISNSTENDNKVDSAEKNSTAESNNSTEIEDHSIDIASVTTSIPQPLPEEINSTNPIEDSEENITSTDINFDESSHINNDDNSNATNAAFEESNATTTEFFDSYENLGSSVEPNNTLNDERASNEPWTEDPFENIMAEKGRRAKNISSSSIMTNETRVNISESTSIGMEESNQTEMMSLEDTGTISTTEIPITTLASTTKKKKIGNCFDDSDLKGVHVIWVDPEDIPGQSHEKEYPAVDKNTIQQDTAVTTMESYEGYLTPALGIGNMQMQFTKPKVENITLNGELGRYTERTNITLAVYKSTNCVFFEQHASELHEKSHPAVDEDTIQRDKAGGTTESYGGFPAPLKIDITESANADYEAKASSMYPNDDTLPMEPIEEQQRKYECNDAECDKHEDESVSYQGIKVSDEQQNEDSSDQEGQKYVKDVDVVRNYLQNHNRRIWSSNEK